MFDRVFNFSSGPAVMPEPAGEQVVDYLAVSEKWKEEKVRLLRVQGREE